MMSPCSLQGLRWCALAAPTRAAVPLQCHDQCMYPCAALICSCMLMTTQNKLIKQQLCDRKAEQPAAQESDGCV